MDHSEIVVSFNLDVEEARRQTAEIQKASVTKASVRVQFSVAVVWLVLGIVEVATDHIRASGWIYILGGCAYVLMALPDGTST